MKYLRYINIITVLSAILVTTINLINNCPASHFAAISGSSMVLINMIEELYIEHKAHKND